MRPLRTIECPHCKETVTKRMRITQIHCSQKCRLRRIHPRVGRTHTPEFRQKLSDLRKSNLGENAPNWQGGKISFHHKMRGRHQWREWRKKIYERDGYKCLDCGSNVNLEPHHILPIRKEEYRARLFDLTNGITLCRQCHQKTFWKEEELARTYFSLIPQQV